MANMKNQRVKNEPSTRDVNAAVRVEHAIRLRCRKTGYTEIARLCGYASAGAAHNAIQRELKRRIHEAVDELRREESEMYDDLQRTVYILAVPDDPSQKPNLFAVDRVLAISTSRRALLGLDVKGDHDSLTGATVVEQYPPEWIEAR